MMEYKLLALDLDGTVVGHDLVIPDSVRNGITALQAQGVAVTLATGRMFGAALPFAKELNITTPIICYQGGMVRHPQTSEIYDHMAMPNQAAAAATTALLEADRFVIAYIDERLCIAAERPELDQYLAYHPEGADVVLDPDLPARVLAHAPTKLLFVAEPEVVTQTLIRMSEQYGEQLSVVRSHSIFGELTAPGVSKGTALAKLSARLGIQREQVVAIGDQENDLSMITWAGLGLAMGNAIPAVREAAAAVLPPVDQAGVAYAIKHYFSIALT